MFSGGSKGNIGKKRVNSSTEVVEYSSSDVSQRYSSDGKYVRGNFDKQRHIDFSVSSSGFCHKSEKSWF